MNGDKQNYGNKNMNSFRMNTHTLKEDTRDNTFNCNNLDESFSPHRNLDIEIDSLAGSQKPKIDSHILKYSLRGDKSHHSINQECLHGFHSGNSNSHLPKDVEIDSFIEIRNEQDDYYKCQTSYEIYSCKINPGVIEQVDATCKKDLNSEGKKCCTYKEGTEERASEFNDIENSVLHEGRFLRKYVQGMHVKFHRGVKSNSYQTSIEKHAAKSQFSYEECGEEYTNKSTMVKHRTHNVGNPYFCFEASESFVHNARLNEHRKTHRRKEKLSCETCGKTLASKSSLKFHMRTHSGEKLFYCAVCGKAFIYKSSIVSHMRTHTGEKLFSCLECGKSFAKKYSLSEHMRTHTGEKKFSCQTCGKALANRSSVKLHMRTHSGEKPFSCADCGKAFINKSTIIKHIRTHTGEKPFSCLKCGKSFAQKSSLREHMRAHTGEKPFKCNDCGKAYSQNSGLIRHNRVHSSVMTVKKHLFLDQNL